MLQVQGNWKAAANLALLLGDTHPPARLERAPDGESGGAWIDARNTANFRTTAYCGKQDVATTQSVRTALTAHYAAMLQRIVLFDNSVMKDGDATAATVGSGPVVDCLPGKAEAVKLEAPSETDEPEGKAGSGIAESENATARADSTTAAAAPASSYRARGILTEVCEPHAVGDELLVPWEFYVVSDVQDEECYLPALLGLVKGASGAACGGGGLARDAAEPNPLREGDEGGGAELGFGATLPGRATRLSLYTRLAEPFTGIYPGMAVGVIGEPFQRSASGLLTGVLVRRFVLPTPPMLPWHVARALTSVTHSVKDEQCADEDGGEQQGASSIPAGGVTKGRPADAAVPPRPVRVHFCSGPFPRRDIAALLRTVTLQALHRGADLLIIGGPLIKPFEDFEKELLPLLGATFAELLDAFVDTIEETLNTYYAARPSMPHMKVILVSHRDDVTQVPVLPTTMYALTDTADIFVRSSPCRVSIDGIHLGICNEDVVGQMQDHMVERWPRVEGSLRRVVEALVRGRLYTPLFTLPATTVDLRHIAQLHIDYVPPNNELLELQPEHTRQQLGSSTKDGSVVAVSSTTTSTSRAWGAIFGLTRSSRGNDVTATEPASACAAPPRKLAKTESRDGALGGLMMGDVTMNTIESQIEYVPHILFLPSARPRFAVVTHGALDEAAVDDMAHASGVLVVNQELWSRRSAPRFELRVAEVTVADSALVARAGASAINGVTCGVLHIYNANT